MNDSEKYLLWSYDINQSMVIKLFSFVIEWIIQYSLKIWITLWIAKGPRPRSKISLSFVSHNQMIFMFIVQLWRSSFTWSFLFFLVHELRACIFVSVWLSLPCLCYHSCWYCCYVFAFFFFTKQNTIRITNTNFYESNLSSYRYHQSNNTIREIEREKCANC